jgi:hypothetical protein
LIGGEYVEKIEKVEKSYYIQLVRIAAYPGKEDRVEVSNLHGSIQGEPDCPCRAAHHL